MKNIIICAYISQLLLEISAESTVQQVLHEMRRRHLIPDLLRVKQHIVFRSYKIAPLSLTDKLGDIASPKAGEKCIVL
jgi:hypothetical protein